jgi:hypothetical protein
MSDTAVFPGGVVKPPDLAQVFSSKEYIGICFLLSSYLGPSLLSSSSFSWDRPQGDDPSPPPPLCGVISLRQQMSLAVPKDCSKSLNFILLNQLKFAFVLIITIS